MRLITSLSSVNARIGRLSFAAYGLSIWLVPVEAVQITFNSFAASKMSCPIYTFDLFGLVKIAS